MRIQTKYIFIIILFSFFISIFVSFNYVNKYDKLNSDLDRHKMIKDNIAGDWNRADELNKLKEEKITNFFYKTKNHKPYLPPRIVALYFSLIKKNIKNKDNNKLHVFELNNGKYGLLVLQTFFYYYCLFLFSKTLLSRKENENIIFFTILFLSIEPTIMQWHSSFFNESIFFSLQIFILVLFFKINKNKFDYIIIGLICGILLLQKSVGVYYVLVILLYLIFTENTEKFKKIIQVFLGYLFVCLLIGYSNYIRSNNFYFTPLQTKEAMFIYVLPKIYEKKEKISFEEAKIKIISKTRIWIKENGVKAKMADNLFIASYGSETDRIKLNNFQQTFVLKEFKENFFLTSQILIKKYFHSLLINPVDVFYFYKYENYESYYKSEDHQKWLPIRIFYTFIIYSICLYGFYTMIKTKKLNKYHFFWILSGLYFYLLLGWMGWTRYFAPVLIYLSLFFATGINEMIFKKKKLI